MFSRTQSLTRNAEDFQSIMKHPDYAYDGIDISSSSRTSKSWSAFNLWPSRKGELQNDPKTAIKNQDLHHSLVPATASIPTGYGGMEVPISSPTKVELLSIKQQIGSNCFDEIKRLGECKNSSKNPKEDCKVDALLLADCASKLICPEQRRLFLIQCKTNSTGSPCHDSAHLLDSCFAQKGLPTGGLGKP